MARELKSVRLLYIQASVLHRELILTYKWKNIQCIILIIYHIYHIHIYNRKYSYLHMYFFWYMPDSCQPFSAVDFNHADCKKKVLLLGSRAHLVQQTNIAGLFNHLWPYPLWPTPAAARPRLASHGSLPPAASPCDASANPRWAPHAGSISCPQQRKDVKKSSELI